MVSITLRPGRERPLRQRHPWVFSGAISAVRGSPAPGEAVEIHSTEGEWLARGFYPRCGVAAGGDRAGGGGAHRFGRRPRRGLSPDL
jgi:PUA-like domain